MSSSPIWSTEPRLGDNGLYALSDGMLSGSVLAATVLTVVLLAATILAKLRLTDRAHAAARAREAGLGGHSS